MSGKAGVLHLHVGDGARGLDLVRQALETTELPARVFHPTHVNRRKALLEEAIALTRQGPTIDITAFPVEEGEDAWSAADALAICLDAGIASHRVTVSSDGGGCLPRFDADGRVTAMDVGQPRALAGELRTLLLAGTPAGGRPARLHRQRGGAVPAGAARDRSGSAADADLVVLDEDHRVLHVMARGRWHCRDGAPRLQGTFEDRPS